MVTVDRIAVSICVVILVDFDRYRNEHCSLSRFVYSEIKLLKIWVPKNTKVA